MTIPNGQKIIAELARVRQEFQRSAILELLNERGPRCQHGLGETEGCPYCEGERNE